MKIQKLRFDPQELHEKAGEILDMISLPERKSWAEHPCTKVLVLIMQARMAYNIEGWMNGAYSAESIEASAQLNAKLIGQNQLMEELLDHIVDIATHQFEESKND